MVGRFREVRDSDSVNLLLPNNLNGVLVDLRSAADYAAEHIFTAQSVPAADLIADPAGSLQGVTTNQPVILYGAGGGKDVEYEAAKALEAAGYANVYYYVTGMANWVAEGGPTVD